MKKNISQLDKNLRLICPSNNSDVIWISPADKRLRIEGLYWFKENKGAFYRLPKSVKKNLRPEVWALAKCPAGGCIAFKSNTTLLRIRVKNHDTSHMPHMPLSGSNGISLFAGTKGELRPWATAVPDMLKNKFEREFFINITPEVRDYRLYLPLYHPLQSLLIGISKNASIMPPSPHVLKSQ